MIGDWSLEIIYLVIRHPGKKDNWRPHQCTYPATQCITLYHNTMHHTVSQCITLYHNTMHHTISQCITLHHNTMHHTVSQCITLYHNASHCITMHHTVSQCITLYYSCRIGTRISKLITPYRRISKLILSGYDYQAP